MGAVSVYVTNKNVNTSVGIVNTLTQTNITRRSMSDLRVSGRFSKNSNATDFIFNPNALKATVVTDATLRIAGAINSLTAVKAIKLETLHECK